MAAAAAARIANLPVWRAHILARPRQQVQGTGDPALQALLDEMRALAGGDVRAEGGDAVALMLELDTDAGRLSLLTATTVFGTPAEVTSSELAIKAFHPADEATAGRLAQLMG